MWRRTSCLMILVALGASGIGAQGVEESPPLTVEGREKTWEFFPPDDFLPQGIAGPHQRGLAVVYESLSTMTAEDSGDSAWALRLKGLYGLVRRHPSGDRDRGWQLGIDAGFYGQFDIDRNYDNIGWDGFYGLAITSRVSDVLAFKFGAFHTSAHVGDEYAERTGRERIGYTREELAATVSWNPGGRWLAYAELAHAYETNNDELQEPGRAELGLEYLAPQVLWGGRFGWYVAGNANTFEERDWEPDLSLQVGLMARSGSRRWRLGLQYYDGRVPLGEFFFEDQTSVSLGLYLDLGQPTRF